MDDNKVTLETPSETRARCEAAGAIWLGDRIEYTLRGTTAPRGAVRTLFARHGFAEHLPSDPRPETLLKRAGREGRTPQGYIVRPFVSPNPDTPLALHVTRVDGTDESGDEYRCLARVRLGYRLDTGTGEEVPCAVVRPPEGQSDYADAVAQERAAEIAEHCNLLLGFVENTDLGIWIRASLAGLGAVQSLGGGNNYFAPHMLCERLHDFFADLAGELGVYYVRDPKTTLGASHERVVMAEAAKVGLQADLEHMREQLERAQQKHDAKVRDPKVPAQQAYLERQLAALQGIGDKLALYQQIVDERVMGPLQALRQQYATQFSALLDGGAALPAGEPSAPAALPPPVDFAAFDEDESEDEPATAATASESASCAPAKADDWWMV